MYKIKSVFSSDGEESRFELRIVYDKAKDRVLTVDDIFVPETATRIKKDFVGYFINLDVNGSRVQCGFMENFGYIGHENDFTNEFKKSIGFDGIVENLIKENEKLEREKKEKLEMARLKELEEEEKIYNAVDKMPRCDFHKKDLVEHFNTNFHWPEGLEEEGYKGRFSVSFIVEKNGSISSVHMRDSTFANTPFEKEMERVIKLLPTFTPGLFINKPVRTRMFYYFSF